MYPESLLFSPESKPYLHNIAHVAELAGKYQVPAEDVFPIDTINSLFERRIDILAVKR